MSGYLPSLGSIFWFLDPGYLRLKPKRARNRSRKNSHSSIHLASTSTSSASQQKKKLAGQAHYSRVLTGAAGYTKVKTSSAMMSNDRKGKGKLEESDEEIRYTDEKTNNNINQQSYEYYENEDDYEDEEQMEGFPGEEDDENRKMLIQSQGNFKEVDGEMKDMGKTGKIMKGKGKGKVIKSKVKPSGKGSRFFFIRGKEPVDEDIELGELKNGRSKKRNQSGTSSKSDLEAGIDNENEEEDDFGLNESMDSTRFNQSKKSFSRRAQDSLKRCFRGESEYISSSVCVNSILISFVVISIITMVFSKDLLFNLIQGIEGIGLAGPFLLSLLYIPISFPFIYGYSAIAVAAGFLFGIAIGTLATLFGSSIGAVLSFIFCRKFFGHKINSHLAKYKLFKVTIKAIEKNAFKVIVMCRLVPIPYGIMNAVLSMAKVKLSTFLMATVVGLLPEALILCYFGTTIRSLKEFMSGEATLDTAHVVLLISGVVAAVLLFLALLKLGRDTMKEMENDERESEIITNNDFGEVPASISISED